MAVIGARPATGFGPLGRRARPRPRPAARTRRRPGALRTRREMVGASGILAAIAAAALLALFYLSQSSHVAATGYEIAALQARIAALRADQQQLSYRIAEARSPAVVERIARGKLQLMPLPTKSVTFAEPTSTDSPN
ncbi:MAG TPA: septum formation initiator family protein [Candidatus Limnocylindrales bacterium]|nr:septum formation initiator family protein [Candidatus Limnocylindrales bacterium]